jgi:uncharacterized LabA/DUF88 family protein
MSSAPDAIARFIDGANLYPTAKTLGFDIDYKRLLKEFQAMRCAYSRSSLAISRVLAFATAISRPSSRAARP